uniref:Serpentine receptor class gamma n=1 Tax=Panagrellus redivivus TaxID=6233 RepID=A0A7E4VZ01_PANRE
MKLSYWSSSRSGITVFLATAPLALGLNVYICRQIMLQRKHKQDDSRTNKTDIQLFAVTIITFFVQCCFNGIQFLFLIPSLQSLGLYLFAAQRYANDAATLLPAWTMIIMNRELRRGIMNLLFGVCTNRYKEGRGSTVVVSRAVVTIPDGLNSKRTEPTV